MKKQPYHYMQRVMDYSLRLANAIDENKGYDGLDLNSVLGCGYRAFTDYVRMSAKEIIDLQMEYYREKERAEIAKVGEEEAEEFLEDIFGDRDIVTISDEWKEKIKAFVKELEESEGD